MIGTLIDKDGVQFDIAMWRLNGKEGVFYAGRISNSEENRKKYGKNAEKQEEEKPKSDIDELPF